MNSVFSFNKYNFLSFLTAGFCPKNVAFDRKVMVLLDPGGGGCSPQPPSSYAYGRHFAYGSPLSLNMRSETDEFNLPHRVEQEINEISKASEFGSHLGGWRHLVGSNPLNPRKFPHMVLFRVNQSLWYSLGFGKWLLFNGREFASGPK